MRSILLAALVAGLFPIQIAGQASVNESTSERVYRDIDKLVAFGLVDNFIFGQRPYSRREIARITAEAEANLSRISRQREVAEEHLRTVRRILGGLQREYRDELVQLGALAGNAETYSVQPLDRVELGIVSLQSPHRAIPEIGAGRSVIDAVVNPLVHNRQGREIVDGNTLWTESEHRLRLGRHVAFYVRPRAQLGLARDGGSDVKHVVVQNLHAKLVFGNFGIEVGRDNLVWGQGEDGGTLISNNPRGFDMVKIGNESPFRLPWILRHAGPTKLTIFLADLGPNQNFPGANLLGYKVSIRPFRILELGGGIIDQSGGEGAPAASLVDRIIDALPFLEEFVGKSTTSSKVATFDFRLRLPPARGTELYGEWAIDDWDLDRLESMLIRESGHLIGVHVPRLVDTGVLDLTLEYHHTGIELYRHTQFISGITQEQLVIGDPLGPDGKGLYLQLNWDFDAANLMSVEGAFEQRSGDQYRLDYPTWVTVQSFPKERRFRAVASWSRQVTGQVPLRLTTMLGYERATNFSFAAGANRNNWLAQVAVELDFAATR